MSGIVLIPAYNPDNELLRLVEELHKNNLKIVVVNDGSNTKCDEIFSKATEYATVISHEKNRGKGAALKTGIAYIKENCVGEGYFITADADGQHLISDILKVREKMEQNCKIVLTTRKFKGDIPFRSRFGNTLSRVVFTMLTGRYFSDNQSGLRGFSTDQCDWLLKVEGDFYDYEMNVLYHAVKQRIPIKTFNIKAVYIDGNKSSNFNPIKDTIKIYKQLFYSARATFFSIALTEILLLITNLSVDLSYLFFTIPTIGIITVVFNVFFSYVISLRGFDFKDAGRMLTRTAIWYSFYILFLWLFSLVWGNLPIMLVLNLLMVIFMIPEYFITKAIYSIIKK